MSILRILILQSLFLTTMNAMDAPAVTAEIKLKSLEEEEIAIPESIARTAEPLRSLMKELEKDQPIPVNFSATVLKDLKEVGLALEKNKQLRGKALAEELLKEIKIADSYAFLKLANYLSSDALLDFAYQRIAQDLHEINKLGQPAQSYKKYEALKQIILKEFGKAEAHRFLKGIIRYYILLDDKPGQLYPLDATSLWGVSIQDYVNFKPEIFQARVKLFGTPWLDLASLQLNSFEGLEFVRSVLTGEELEFFNDIVAIGARNNAFHTLSKQVLAPLNFLHSMKSLDLNNNNISLIEPFAYQPSSHFTEINLSNNPRIMPNDPAYAKRPLNVEKGAFGFLTTDILDLRGTTIGKIRSRMFDGLSTKSLLIDNVVAIEPFAFAGLNVSEGPVKRAVIQFESNAADLPSEAFADAKIEKLVLVNYPKTVIDPSAFLGHQIKEIVFEKSALEELRQKWLGLRLNPSRCTTRTKITFE